MARHVVASRRVILAAPALLLLVVVAAQLDPRRQRWVTARIAEERERQVAEHGLRLKESAAQPASGTLNLDFSHLSFHPPTDELARQGTTGGFEPWLPAGIRAYDGREIRIQGYMLPTRTAKGLVREGVILRNQLACCFGQAPRFCEFIVMRMEGQPVSIPMDQPVTFTGRFQIHDVFDAGNWINLYTLECTKVE